MSRHAAPAAVTEHIEYESGRRKNVCTAGVLQSFGIFPDRYRYAQNDEDVKRILRRNGFAVRSRRSMLPRSVRTVSALRRWLADGHGDPRAIGYYVGVPGHAISLGPDGRIGADTAPRKSDRRKLVHVHAVWPKR